MSKPMHAVVVAVVAMFAPAPAVRGSEVPNTPAPPNGASGAAQHATLSWQFAPGAEGVVMYATAQPGGGSSVPEISSLYRVDPATGAFTLIGSIGFRGVNGMTFGPDGVLYAGAAGENPPGSANPRRADLIRIDTATGAGTFLSIIGMSTVQNSIFRVQDLATAPSGVIYGLGYVQSDSVLFTIDPLSGVVNIIGPVGDPAFLNAIDFALDGTLHGIVYDNGQMSDRVRFAIVDPATGARTPTHQINGASGSDWPVAGDLPGGHGDFYFGLRKYNPDAWRLMRADPATGVVTLDVAAPTGLDGLASTSAVTYDVYLDQSNPPTTLVCDDTPSLSCGVGPLQRCTTYYWRVVANVNGVPVDGPVWAFETGFFSGADTDGDGDVDFIDLNNLLGDFGLGPACPPAP